MYQHPMVIKTFNSNISIPQKAQVPPKPINVKSLGNHMSLRISNHLLPTFTKESIRTGTNMCYIVLSTCRACAFPISTRHARCSHAEMHGFDPLSCPNRMRRRRQSSAVSCGKCGHRRGSLSCLPRSRACSDRDSDGSVELGAVGKREFLWRRSERRSKRQELKRRVRARV